MDPEIADRMHSPLSQSCCLSIRLGQLDHDMLEEAYERFFRSINELFNDFFPEKKLKCNSRPQKKSSTQPKRVNTWFSPELSMIRNFVLTVRDNYESTTCPRDKEKLHALYSKVRCMYKNKILNAKKCANVSDIENAPNPCKVAWNLIYRRRDPGRASKSTYEASPDEFNEFLLQNVKRIIVPVSNVNEGCELVALEEDNT
ncbi:hypothetical protein LSTR_LSTR006470 [Laodelphax striatellus]|uniref:Uncharacterized protein n=1 Tax=Laodelphax striatellus TaxID=195883 RepID=A0A482WY23_LAOST|nr:hypothetical protein LSTR_LSTR006470 [Laodelphax striatellus]